MLPVTLNSEVTASAEIKHLERFRLNKRRERVCVLQFAGSLWRNITSANKSNHISSSQKALRGPSRHVALFSPERGTTQRIDCTLHCHSLLQTSGFHYDTQLQGALTAVETVYCSVELHLSPAHSSRTQCYINIDC